MLTRYRYISSTNPAGRFLFFQKEKGLASGIGLLLLLVSLLLLVPMEATSQVSQAMTEPGTITIEKGGELWIEGSASIVDYTCRAEELSGNGTIRNTEQPRQNVTGEGSVAVMVSVPVRSLECGKKAMNRDMYEALKADRHPSIHYQLLEADLADNATEDDSVTQEGWMNIVTRGILEIAGVQDTTTVLVQGKLLSPDRFRVKGNKQLNMKTFDIKPPTALMGLIRASNKLSVHFDVVVRLESNQATSR